MSKPISKVPVCCPHCGGEQQEPELAKSTFCRSCSQYFAITPSTLASAKPVSTVPKEAKPKFGLPSILRVSHPPQVTAPGSSEGGLLQKLETLFSKPRMRLAQCFECTSSQEVSSSTHYSTCRACGAYIDLQDYKINGSFSRNIKTRGSVYLGPKGDLSSSKIICAEAVIHGKMRGNMNCFGKVVIRVQGRLAGSLNAGSLTIEKGSEVIFSRPVKSDGVVIAGKMSGRILSGSNVTIHRTGSLDGAVVATGFNVEKGGCFQGELTISPRGTSGIAPGELDSPQVTLPPRFVGPQSGLDAFIAGEENPASG